jgi:hypothetical protein
MPMTTSPPHGVDERDHIGKALDMIALAVAVGLLLVVDIKGLRSTSHDQALQVSFGDSVEGGIEERHFGLGRQ